MSYFTLSDNTTPDSDKFDSGAGNSVIPDDTTCLAMIDECAWAEFNGDEHISLRWTIVQPEIYKNRKVFQKIRVNDADIKKQDKAKRMLFAIDKNAGGHLIAAGEEPTDSSLAKALMSKLMLIKVMIWEMDGKQGNWVAAVSPRTQAAPVQTAAPVQHDDIPF